MSHRPGDQPAERIPAGTLPAQGDYHHLPVIAPYRVDLAAAQRGRTFFGLSCKATLCYGTFRDEHGVAYAAIRKVGWDSASPLTIQAALDGGAFRVQAGPDAFSGWGVRETFRGGVLAHESVEGTAGEPFRLEHRDDSLSWDEGAALSLNGALVGGCGIQWYDPSPPGGFYTSEQFRVSGTVLGAEVDGFVALDQLYLPAGMTWFESPYFASPPYLEIAWHTFATELDDGRTVAGQVFYGAQRMSFAAIVDDEGPAVFTRDVRAEISAAPDGYPSEIVYWIDGERWLWTADEQWHMPDFSQGYPDDTYRASDGLFRRAGETSSPRVWWSFVDTWTNRRHPW